MPLLKSITAISILASLISFTAWQEARAEETNQKFTAKKFRVHIDTNLLGVVYYKDKSFSSGDTFVQFGFFRNTKEQFLAGFGSSFIAFGFSGAVVPNRGFLGARVGLLVDSYVKNSWQLGGMLAPYFRWIFLPGKRFRPYVEGHFGFGGIAGSGSRYIAPFVGAGGGVHIWLVDMVSVDLGVNLDYYSTHGRPSDRPFEKGGDGFSFDLTTGLSLWF